MSDYDPKTEPAAPELAEATPDILKKDLAAMALLDLEIAVAAAAAGRADADPIYLDWGASKPVYEPSFRGTDAAPGFPALNIPVEEMRAAALAAVRFAEDAAIFSWKMGKDGQYQEIIKVAGEAKRAYVPIYGAPGNIPTQEQQDRAAKLASELGQKCLKRKTVEARSIIAQLKLEHFGLAYLEQHVDSGVASAKVLAKNGAKKPRQARSVLEENIGEVDRSEVTKPQSLKRRVDSGIDVGDEELDLAARPVRKKRMTAKAMEAASLGDAEI